MYEAALMILPAGSARAHTREFLFPPVLVTRPLPVACATYKPAVIKVFDLHRRPAETHISGPATAAAAAAITTATTATTAVTMINDMRESQTASGEIEGEEARLCMAGTFIK